MLPDPTQADPSIVALMHGLKTSEGTKGNYNTIGDQGTAAGIGQWSNQINGKPQPIQKGQIPANFANNAKQYGLDPADFSPENQNKVMYASLAADKKAGLQPEQILSKWNSGDPNKYQTAQAVGTGPVGAYDVADYVKRGMTAAQQYAQKNKNQTPQNPLGADTADASNGQKPEEQHSLLGKLIDFAFPIAGDIGADVQGKSDKSALQQIGDAGLSALWFAPGVGEAAGAAIKGAGLLGETGARIAGHTLGGAVSGYGADVASNLSQGKTDSSVFTPGLGTVGGGVLGGVLGKIGSKYSQAGVLNDITKSNNSIIGQTKRGAQDLAESFSKDRNQGALIAQKGINLASTANPETVAYETAQHAQKFRTDANVLTDTLTEALKQVPGATNATDLEQALISKITANAPDKITAAEQAQLIRDEFAKIRSQYGEQLSAADMNSLKKRAWNLSKFDAATPNMVRNTQRLIGNALKTEVENTATKAGLDGVREMNDYIGSHLDAADTLDRLHGMKAKGGRLGDLMQKHTLGAIGGVSGAFGGGPVGALMGAMGGEFLGGKLSGILRKVGGSPIKTAILQRMVREDPEVVQKILAYAKQTPQGLEAIKEQLGKKGIGIFNRLENKQNVSPLLKPKSITEGLVPRALGLKAEGANPVKTSNGVAGLIKKTPAFGQAKITDLSQFEKAKDLSPEHAALEGRAFQHVLKNEDSILAAYKAKHGNVINADNFRPFFKDVGYAGHNAAAVQEPSSYLAKRARTEALNNPQRDAVAFAGGSGTGKTSAIKSIPELSRLVKNSAAVVDSNFSNISSARKFIQEAESKGKRFTGIYTYRDAVDSMVQGVVKRMLTNPEEMGRVVPTKVVAGNHIDSFDVVKKLVEEGKKFWFLDNSLGDGKAKVVSLKELEQKIKYPSKDELTKIFNEEVTKLYKNKTPFKGHVITPEQYKALIS